MIKTVFQGDMHMCANRTHQIIHIATLVEPSCKIGALKVYRCESCKCYWFET